MKADRKRVLVLARWPVGGIRTYFRYMYSDEVFAHYHFTFVLPASDQSSPVVGQALDKSCYVIVDGGNTSKSLMLSAYKELRSNTYDLIHTHGFTAGVMSLAMQFKFGVPNLLTTHDVFNDAMFHGFKGKIKKLGMALVLRSTTHINPVGEDATENLLDFFPELEQKTTAIRNGIPTEHFSMRPARNLKDELELGADSFLVGFFGRFMAQKGFKYLVKAIGELAKNYASTQVRVVCFGWGGFIREEQQSIREQGLEDYFSFLPQTDDMPGAIKGVDIVAMPSLWEACPLLPMEVLSCGVPIVGTSCVGSSEVFEGTPAYVVSPGSSEQIKEALLREMQASSKDRFSQFSQVAVEKFKCKVSAEKLEALYQKLI